MRILKEKGDLIFNEEMEELKEPFDTENAPGPTSEEVPMEDDPEMDSEMPEEIPQEEPVEDVGIDPAESFYPPNEDYDYAPDVHLTGDPNDGIKYPAGSEAQVTSLPEGELGIQESRIIEGSFKRGQKVTAKSNINFEGQKIPKGTIGVVKATQMSYGSNSDIYVIDFGEGLGEFDFYKKDLRYLESRRGKDLKRKKEMAWRDNNASNINIWYNKEFSSLNVEEGKVITKYKGVNWNENDFTEFVEEFKGRIKPSKNSFSDFSFRATLSIDPRPELNKVFGEGTIQESNKGKGESMKILTKKEAMEVAKKHIAEAKKVLAMKEELDLDGIESGDNYDIEAPPVDGEMMDDELMGEEGIEEPETPEDLASNILADAEALYSQIVGEEEGMEGEEGMEDNMDGDEMTDESVPSIEMMEARKAKIIKEAKKKLQMKRIKAKIKEARGNFDAGEDMDNEINNANFDPDEELIDTLYEGNDEKAILRKKVKEALAAKRAGVKKPKITESAESIEELYTVLDNFKYGNEAASNPNIRKTIFEEALEILGFTPKSTHAVKAWDNISEGYSEAPEMEDDMDMEVPGSEEYDTEEDAFFEEAAQRSKERKAYIKKILQEEDTPIMSEQPEVEELMGLKILKKMGEDPKLVEGKGTESKFVESYKSKKSFNFKELLNNGFLG